MFLDFYKMREQPFGVTPDPRFLYLGQSHREALASLFYAIESDRGFVALIAHPGLGKTTLTFQLLEKLERTRTVFLFHTQCSSQELFHYILNDLGVDASGMDMVSMHSKLNEILFRERLAGRRFVLAVDEAQNLDPSVLETIRLLSNFETSQTKLLQILLIGQPQLARKLADPALLQLEQRIAVFARLQPFDPEETACYIAHRLKVAGYDAEPLFTPGALRIIVDRSKGIPRNINSLCFSALSIGCATGRKQIDAEIMREVIADLDVESLNVLALTHRATNATVTVTPALSYSTKSERRLRRWALGIVSAAASIAVVCAFLIYSPLLHSRSAHAGESAAVPPSPVTIPGRDSETTFTVVVQPGDSLQMIALKFLGQYNGKLVEQIQELNPAVTDADHIEPGQEIRLPNLSNAVKTPSAGGPNEMTAKN